MGNEEPSGQQAVDIEAALRWADRHEARERQKLRDMGLPPEGDMPVTGAFFVRGLVAMLRTAAPTAPSTAAADTARLDFLDRCNARLNAESGTSYHWKLTLNHNVSRLMLGHLEVDLNDAEARGLPSCRDAIDAKMRECGTPVLASAPSTVVGEEQEECRAVLRAYLDGIGTICGANNREAAFLERIEDMAKAAIATPPAQGVEEETETLENLIDAAIGARTTPPWQEQAAQIRRDALEEAAKICDEMYVTFSSSMSPDRKNNKSWAMAANALADKIRALVRSEKGEGK